MIKNIALFFVLFFCVSLAKAQLISEYSGNNGSVVIENDANLVKLTDFYKKINIDKCPKVINGFRVQIFTCSGPGCPEKAEELVNKFAAMYPTITVHQVWDPPSHKVRVGDCRNSFEAQKIKSILRTTFPSSFIVPDYIEPVYFDLCNDK